MSNHGNTPAAWTAVVVALIGIILAGIGLMVHSWLMFWIGLVLIPIGLIAGGIISKVGPGAHE